MGRVVIFRYLPRQFLLASRYRMPSKLYSCIFTKLLAPLFYKEIAVAHQNMNINGVTYGMIQWQNCIKLVFIIVNNLLKIYF